MQSRVDYYFTVVSEWSGITTQQFPGGLNVEVNEVMINVGGWISGCDYYRFVRDTKTFSYW